MVSEFGEGELDWLSEWGGYKLPSGFTFVGTFASGNVARAVANEIDGIDK